MSALQANYDYDEAVWVEPEPERPGTVRMRRWRQRNPERARLQSQVAMHRSNSRRRGLLTTLTVAEWVAVLDRYGRCCVACGSQPASLAIDCVKPQVFGGSLTVDNVQPLCRSCNSRKGQRTIDYRNQYDKQAAD